MPDGSKATLPYAGLKVLELGSVIAGPFAASLMGDLGAAVIKIEPPGQPDPLRKMGYKKTEAYPWWGVASRDKECITLNLKAPEGKEIFLRLIDGADVLIENYRPGVLNRLGLGWEALHARNPRLIQLSISGYGQRGPKSPLPGFGKIAEGLSGIVNLTGARDEKPLFVGYSLADTSAGMFGTLGIAMALYQRDLGGGQGVHIDVALYEPLFRMMECQMPLAQDGLAPARQGSNDPYGWGLPPRPESARFLAVQDCAGDWFQLRVADPGVAMRLDTLAAAAGFTDRFVAWAATQDAASLRQMVLDAGADIAPIMDGLRLGAEPYFAARGDVLAIDTPETGPMKLHAGMHPGNRSTFRNPDMGADNEVVLGRELGMAPDEVKRLAASGVI